MMALPAMLTYQKSEREWEGKIDGKERARRAEKEGARKFLNRQERMYSYQVYTIGRSVLPTTYYLPTTTYYLLYTYYITKLILLKLKWGLWLPERFWVPYLSLWAAKNNIRKVQLKEWNVFARKKPFFSKSQCFESMAKQWYGIVERKHYDLTVIQYSYMIILHYSAVCRLTNQ